MPETTPTAATETWLRPVFEVIPLDCEITAYAPDDGESRPEF